MDAQRSFLEELKKHGLDKGHTLGLLHLLIGRRIEKLNGQIISRGLTWRELAGLLKKARWPKEGVRDLGLDPAKLPPRDRMQFWYLAIGTAQVDSEAARQAGNTLAALLEPLDYRVA